MSTQHTPGPWVLDPQAMAHVLGNDYHVIQAGVGFHPEGLTEAGFCLSGYMSAEDARLIASAPGLFSLARRWAALDGNAWHVARHAKDKAELLAKTHAVLTAIGGGASHG